MSTETEILYVPEMAKLCGRTEAAVRSAVNRGGADWLPPRLNTRRLAWRKSTALAFLSSLEKPAKKGAR